MNYYFLNQTRKNYLKNLKVLPFNLKQISVILAHYCKDQFAAEVAVNCASEPCRTKSRQGCWDPSGEQQWGFRSAEGQTKHPGANNYATHFGWCSKQESLPSSLGVQGLESIPTALTFNEQKKMLKTKPKYKWAKSRSTSNITGKPESLKTFVLEIKGSGWRLSS